MRSPTWGKITLTNAVNKIKERIEINPKDEWKIYVGTDSQKFGIKIVYVTALVLHHVGSGGIYFYDKNVVEKKISLQERLFTEAYMSIDFAGKFFNEIKEKHLSDFINYDNFEIHLDLGTKGESKSVITSILGMVKGSGYNVHIKPDSCCASIVADRKTKTLR